MPKPDIQTDPRGGTPPQTSSLKTVSINIHSPEINNLKPLKEDELQLLSVRSEGQFNTVVYEDEDLYRGQDRRNVVLMKKNDMDRLGFIKDDRVIVKSKTGVLDNILARPFDIKKGAVLMYYPEVNSLVSQEVDPQSRTPSFKSTLVTVQPYS